MDESRLRVSLASIFQRVDQASVLQRGRGRSSALQLRLRSSPARAPPIAAFFAPLNTNLVVPARFGLCSRRFSSSFERCLLRFTRPICPLALSSYLLPQSFSQELLNTPTVVLFQQPSEGSAPSSEAGSSQMSHVFMFSPADSVFMPVEIFRKPVLTWSRSI